MARAAPPLEWSDLRLFLAIAREGTLGAAARRLKLSQPTMGRRLRALEDAVGHTLFQRTSDGFVLTAEGSVILEHAERIEEETLALARQLGSESSHLEGLVRVASSDWFGAEMLAPVLAEFVKLNPAIEVELLTDTRLYSLSRREADLAFRIKPFDEPDVISRRLVRIEYGVYVRSGTKRPRRRDGTGTRLVTMSSDFDSMPDAVWLRRMLPKAKVAARSNSRSVQSRMCADGAGVAVLPRPMGDALGGVDRIDLGEAPPARETFVGYHRDLRRLARLRALLDLVLARLGN